MNKKDILRLKGIFSFISWFIIVRYSDILLGFIGIDISKFNIYIKMIFNVSMEILSIGVIFYLFKKELTNMFEDFYENSRYYFSKYFKCWFWVLICMYIGNFVIILLSPNMAGPNNQELIVEMFKQHPIYTFILSVILAPIIEELVFRFGFKHIFTNKHVFILISGLIFGAFHIIGSYETLSDLLYIIPYSIPGLIFAKVYYESKNVFITMWLHFVHNGSVMLLQVLLLIFNVQLPF